MLFKILATSGSPCCLADWARVVVSSLSPPSSSTLPQHTVHSPAPDPPEQELMPEVGRLYPPVGDSAQWQPYRAVYGVRALASREREGRLPYAGRIDSRSPVAAALDPAPAGGVWLLTGLGCVQCDAVLLAAPLSPCLRLCSLPGSLPPPAADGRPLIDLEHVRVVRLAALRTDPRSNLGRGGWSIIVFSARCWREQSWRARRAWFQRSRGASPSSISPWLREGRATPACHLRAKRRRRRRTEALSERRGDVEGRERYARLCLCRLRTAALTLQFCRPLLLVQG